MDEGEIALRVPEDTDSEDDSSHPIKKRHSIAVNRFSGGEPMIVEADEYRVCVPTKDCVQFWATIVVCFAAIVFSAVMMVVQGPSSPLFYLWEAVFALAWGVLVPSPNYSLKTFKRPN